MTDYQELVKRLREYYELRELRTCAEAADALEHMALSHDAMVQEIETLRRERDSALHYAEARLVALRETESELRYAIARAETAEQERDEARAQFDAHDELLHQVIGDRNAAIARAEKAERERDEAHQRYVDANEARIDAEKRALTLAHERAELYDKLAGTPCAEVRWQHERDALRALLREAGEALDVFLGADERFQVAIGGNPYAVDEVLNHFRAVLARIKEALK